MILKFVHVLVLTIEWAHLLFIGLKCNSEKVTFKLQNETQPGSEDAGYQKLNLIDTEITGMESPQQTSLP